MTPERWKQVSRIYGAVVSRAPHERGAALDLACGDDAELRRDVESLLAEENGSVVVDRPAFAATDVLTSQMPVQIGSQIGVYRIDALLGAGGMGQVYRATDTRLQRTVLGTFQYMAPEQLEGREADMRTDIFALGVVIYELVTGKKAFEGKSQASLIGAIMHAEPAPMATLQPLTPPALERIVRTCLAKDPDARWQSAADLARELRWVTDSPSVSAPVAAKPTTVRRLMVTVVALIAGIIIGFAGALTRSTVHGNPVTRFVIEMPPTHDLYTGGGSRPVFSPDGRSLVYAGVPATGGVMLFRRAFDQLTAQPIPGTESATNPFFSPDGRFLAFGGRVPFGTGKVGGLRKLDLSTGSVMTLLRCPRACRGGFWAADDTIWFSDESGNSGVIAHVPAAGGLPARIPSDATVGRDDLYPQLLPGGKGVLATEVSRGVVGTTLATAHVTAISVESGQHHQLYEGAGAQYTPTGHLVFARGDTLLAVPFDVAQLKPNGTPVPVIENVQVNSGGLALFAVSNDGTLAYVPGVAGTSRSLAWIDRQGREEAIIGMPERSYVIPQLSPDGRRIALDVRDQLSDIYVWDIARRQLSRVTSDPAIDGFPVWSADSRRIAFASTRGGAMNLFVQDVDETDAERLTESASTQIPVAFSQDGAQLFYLEDTAPGGTTLHRIALARARQDERLIEWSTQVTSVSIAPDDSWVAYQMNDSGQDEIFVQPIKGTTTERHQISVGGGTRPLWGSNGQDLFYIGGDDRLTSVRIQKGPSFSASEPTSILPARYFNAGPGRTYTVSRDGGRFLMIKEGSGRGQSAHIVVVQNWTEELKQRVPVR